MDNKNDLEPRKVANYVLAAMLLLLVLWLNYGYLSSHLSSNREVISSYTPKEDEMIQHKAPAVAGLFYAANPQQLQQDVGHYLDVDYERNEKKPRILIVPHAGYEYSAQVAAKAYVELGKYSGGIKNVIVVGPAHFVNLKGAALPSHGYFSTPLGEIPVNQQLIDELKENPLFKINDQAFAKEHSVEVQLPFLQKMLKNFKVVPIVYGQVDPQQLAAALQKLAQAEDTVLVFSADLSHYYDAPVAEKIDRQTAKIIAEGNADITAEMSCGAEGINAAMILAKQLQMSSRLLDLTHSGKVRGDMSRVVGYGAWSFDETPKDEKVKTKLEQEAENLKSFANRYGNDLFAIANRSLEYAVLKDKVYNPSRDDYADDVFDKGAAFVTLYKNGQLRGCIGSLIPRQAVALDVAQNTYKAAFEDTRFEPVTPEELKELSLSISFLTDYEKIEFANEEELLEQIVQGTDGVVLRDGDRQGLFLPSVWAQMKDKKEFLQELKLKAGMSPSYWSDKIKAYRFRTVEIKKNEN